MIRVFISSKELDSNSLTLDKKKHHHLVKVLRLNVNEGIEIVVDEAELITATVTDINPDNISINVSAKNPIAPSIPHITLIQALPKQDKMSDIVKKCTELGVKTIIPILSERSIPKLDAKKAASKIDRWQDIARNEACQARIDHIPTIHPPSPLRNLKSMLPDADAYIVFWEETHAKTLRDHLNTLQNPSHICILIGPEGGLSQNEINELETIGFTDASLGKTILRVENAAFMAMSNIRYHYQK